jgi:acyl carrier protein
MTRVTASVREAIFDQIRSVAESQEKILEPLTDDLVLLESGLDSLCVAILVANLEDELGVDPFGSGEDVNLPTTVGEFVRLYEDAAGT